MTEEWDGITERRSPHSLDGEPIDGRRRTDWHCTDHALIQETTKLHRANVCRKIEKIDASNKDKLDRWIFIWLAGGFGVILILLSGYLGNKMDSGFMTLHSRITATQIKIDVSNETRAKADLEQAQKLESIDGKLGTVSWRLTQLEESHKPANKFVPDTKR